MQRQGVFPGGTRFVFRIGTGDGQAQAERCR